MQSLLTQADRSVDKLSEQVNKRWYPCYHIAPRAGWLNDPNGMIWFNGYYHVFYQQHPYSVMGGTKYWGHVRSQDLLHWEHLPTALAPEGQEDREGCYSGTAVVAGDTLALVYTGHKFHGDSSTDDNLYQVQCLATSQDGIHFQRQGMIVDTPQGLHHFRDPKVWQSGEMWYMGVGTNDNNVGQIRLFESHDLHHWQPAGVLAQADRDMGFMWECPDFFPLGDKHILAFSPQGLAAQGYLNRNPCQSGYFVGQWQPGEPFVADGEFVELDHGHNFYAHQSLLAPDGRRIVVGWLNMWEETAPEQQDGWAGMLSLPRELTLGQDNRLRMVPIRELNALRDSYFPCEQSSIQNERIPLTDDAQAVEVLLNWQRSACDAELYGLEMASGLRIYVDDQAQRLVVERRYPEHKLEDMRSVALPDSDRLSLRIFFDRSSVEVFVNDGEACLSSRIFPQDQQRQLSLFAHSGTAKIIESGYWRLKATS